MQFFAIIRKVMIHKIMITQLIQTAERRTLGDAIALRRKESIHIQIKPLVYLTWILKRSLATLFLAVLFLSLPHLELEVKTAYYSFN